MKKKLKKAILLSTLPLSFFLSIECFNNTNSQKFKFSLNWIHFSYGSSEELKQLKCSELLKEKPSEEALFSDEMIPTQTHRDQSSEDNEVHQVKNYLIDFAGDQLGDSWVNKIENAKRIYWSLKDIKQWIHFLKTEVGLTHKEVQASLTNAHILIGLNRKTVLEKYNFLNDIVGQMVLKNEIIKSFRFYDFNLKNLKALSDLSKFGLRINDHVLIKLDKLDFKTMYLKNQLFFGNRKSANRPHKEEYEIESPPKVEQIFSILWQLAKSYVESNLEKHNLNQMTVNEWATKYIYELIKSSFYVSYVPFQGLYELIHFLKTKWGLTNNEIFHQILEDPRMLFITRNRLEEVSHLLIPYARAHLERISQHSTVKKLFDQNKKASEKSAILSYIQSKFKDSIIILNVPPEKLKGLFLWFTKIGFSAAEIYELIPQIYSTLLFVGFQKHSIKQPKMYYWTNRNLENLSQIMTFYAKKFVMDKTGIHEEMSIAVEREAKKLVRSIALKNFRIFDQSPLKTKEIIEILKGKNPFLVRLEDNSEIIESRFKLDDQTIHVPLHFTDSEIFEMFIKHSSEFSIFPSRLNRMIQLTWNIIQQYIPKESDQEKIQNHDIETIDQFISRFIRNLSKELGTLALSIKKKDFHNLMKHFKENWGFKNLDLLELMSKHPRLLLNTSDSLILFFEALNSKLEIYISRKLELFYQLQKKRNQKKMTINMDRKNIFKKNIAKIIFEFFVLESLETPHIILPTKINKNVQQSLNLLEKDPQFLESIFQLIQVVPRNSKIQ